MNSFEMQSEGLALMSRFVINMFFALLLFVPGLYLILNEYKKTEEKRKVSFQVVGIVFIATAFFIAFGFGAIK